MSMLKNGSLVYGIVEQQGEDLYFRTSDDRLYRVPKGYESPRNGRKITRRLHEGDSLCVPFVGVNKDKPFWPHLEHTKES